MKQAFLILKKKAMSSPPSAEHQWCSACGKKLRRGERALSNHLRYCQGDTEGASFLCGACGFICREQQDYNQHCSTYCEARQEEQMQASEQGYEVSWI